MRRLFCARFEGKPKHFEFRFYAPGASHLSTRVTPLLSREAPARPAENGFDGCRAENNPAWLCFVYLFIYKFIFSPVKFVQSDESGGRAMCSDVGGKKKRKGTTKQRASGCNRSRRHFRMFFLLQFYLITLLCYSSLTKWLTANDFALLPSNVRRTLQAAASAQALFENQGLQNASNSAYCSSDWMKQKKKRPHQLKHVGKEKKMKKTSYRWTERDGRLHSETFTHWCLTGRLIFDSVQIHCERLETEELIFFFYEKYVFILIYCNSVFVCYCLHKFYQ